MVDGEASIDAEAAAQIAYDGCVFGYPLVLLDLARRQHPAGANRLHHQGGGERPYVPHPNPQVLYSTAWLDLASGPVALGLPDLHDHQLLISMIDSRGRVFATAGARETGVSAREITIVGPAWSGDVDQGLRAVRAPTEAVWLVVRVPVDPEAEAVGPALQRRLYLMPLGRRLEPGAPADPPSLAAGWPSRVCAVMDGESFLGRLAILLDQRPASRRDAVMMEQLRRIGLVPGRPFDLGRLPSGIAEAVRAGVAQAQAVISARLVTGETEAPWAVVARERGRADEPLSLAVLANGGIGLSFKEDAIYFVADTDSDGQLLNGAHRYRLHFDQFKTPQVEGAWSLTAYDLNGDLAATPGGRLGLTSQDRLRFNADGSIDLRIQAEPPLDPLAANWTPCPPGGFRLVLRAYWPRHTLLTGLWRPPAVSRMHDYGLRAGAPTVFPRMNAALMARAGRPEA
jgi:hypothetical protein